RKHGAAVLPREPVTVSGAPPVAGGGTIMLNLAPMAAAGEPAEADMLARVRDGETIVVSGFSRRRETRERTNAGIKGGWFGRSTVVTKKRVETVILLTPRILAPVGSL